MGGGGLELWRDLVVLSRVRIISGVSDGGHEMLQIG